LSKIKNKSSGSVNESVYRFAVLFSTQVAMLSVAIITFNEEANIGRTLRSVIGVADEVLLVDSGSTDRTLEIAREFGAKVKVYSEPWMGFARQKNSAIEKCTGVWVLSLDADEELTPDLAGEIASVVEGDSADGYWIKRLNHFLGRPLRHGGQYPDPKLRLFRRGKGRCQERAVHETFEVDGHTATLENAMLHHSYPTLTDYIEHMNHYSSLGAEVAAGNGKTSRNIVAFWFNVVVRPRLQFVYNYIFRGGFLDGREGFLLHWYHQTYASWKYAKAWERGRRG
jgi:glycosyltransferase involved in cell wall biosynthesis